jgi:hypothetical protein
MRSALRDPPARAPLSGGGVGAAPRAGPRRGARLETLAGLCSPACAEVLAEVLAGLRRGARRKKICDRLDTHCVDASIWVGYEFHDDERE